MKDLTDVGAIGAGADHGVALKADGTVWTWGANQAGQLGNGTIDQNAHLTATQVGGLAGIRSIAAGRYHNLALQAETGTVMAWGLNTAGQLGDGSTTTRSSPVQVQGLGGVLAVAGGLQHSLALVAAR